MSARARRVIGARGPRSARARVLRCSVARGQPLGDGLFSSWHGYRYNTGGTGINLLLAVETLEHARERARDIKRLRAAVGRKPAAWWRRTCADLSAVSWSDELWQRTLYGIMRAATPLPRLPRTVLDEWIDQNRGT